MSELPLPDSAVLGVDRMDNDITGYTADQMREYGRACERAAYERAVNVCEELEAELNAKAELYPGGESDIAWRLARRIEALGADK